MRTGAANQQGFTLLEVLVAFTIAASAVLAVLYSLSEGLWRLQRITDYAEAAMVAESRLAEVGVIYPIVSGERQGADENDVYQWTVNLERYSDDDIASSDGDLALFDVLVRVNWSSANKPRQFTLYSQKAALLDE